MIRFNVDSAFKPNGSHGILLGFNFSEIADIFILEEEHKKYAE